MARKRTNPNTETTRQVEQHLSQVRDAMEEMVGVVGDQSSATTRSGDDTRKRGWFWHWNHIVTQYAPLIGLKGVGLLNSYTVWTDRREESPHRGYAFPSQQSEADFYGEDRAELITINKILVALDLIEIRKEMVYRTDERGRRWKVPHNFYRVKDKGDGVSLTTGDVQRVIELAAKDRAVYRYLRKLFSPKFSPIDGDNVWHQILAEVQQTETWQELAARTARDEARASARSKAGHASRRASDTNQSFSLPQSGDNATPETSHNDTANDSTSVASGDSQMPPQTSVALSNNGLMSSVEPTNKGFDPEESTTVAPAYQAEPTIVAPINSTYNQEKTTTTTGPGSDSSKTGKLENSAPDRGIGAEPIATETLPKPNATVDDRQIAGPGVPPDSVRDQDRALRVFEEANERASTMAERRLLRNLAESFGDVATVDGANGWAWIADAIDEAVASGSTYVAPKRIREILQRWSRDGRDDRYVAVEQSVDRQTHPPRTTQRESTDATLRSAPPDPFDVSECGMTSTEIWQRAVAQLRTRPEFSRVGAETWLRDTHLIARTETGDFVIGVANPLALQRLSGRYQLAISQVLAEVTGLRHEVSFADYRHWQPDSSRESA